MKYRLRTLDVTDLPMLAAWLRTPEVVRWWGEPGAQFELIAGDIDDLRMRQWIVEYAGAPFAYVQAYPLRAWPQPHLDGMPGDTEMIDAFIGVPELLGRGHGSALLKAFAERLMAEGTPFVAIDPAADNLRARRAYARAGFVGEAISETENGPVTVMVFKSAAA